VEFFKEGDVVRGGILQRLSPSRKSVPGKLSAQPLNNHALLFRGIACF
jgi:hypothetical protein